MENDGDMAWCREEVKGREREGERENHVKRQKLRKKTGIFNFEQKKKDKNRTVSHRTISPLRKDTVQTLVIRLSVHSPISRYSIELYRLSIMCKLFVFSLVY